MYAVIGGAILEKKIRFNESKTNVTSMCVHAIPGLRACSIVPKEIMARLRCQICILHVGLYIASMGKSKTAAL